MRKRYSALIFTLVQLIINIEIARAVPGSGLQLFVLGLFTVSLYLITVARDVHCG